MTLYLRNAGEEWDLEDGVQIARSIEGVAALLNAHVALTGSVLYKGRSYKDLDLFVYRHDNSPVTARLLRKLAENVAAAFGGEVDREHATNYRRQVVVVRMADGRRIDFLADVVR